MHPTSFGEKLTVEREPETKSRLRSMVQIGVYAVLIFGLVPYGAVHDLPKLFVAGLAAVVCAFACWIDVSNGATRRLIRDCWFVLFLLVSFALAQSIGVENNPFAHPFWQSAGELAGFKKGAISLEPSLTQFGLFSLIPPFLLFIAILHAFQKDADAWRLIKALGWLGLAFIVYGLVQAVFFPNYVLIRDLGSAYHALTGTLIYRNAAATLIGVASLIFLAIVIHNSRGISIFTFPVFFLMPNAMKTRQRLVLFVWLAAVFFGFIALFLTHSRGALGATIVAWAVLTPPLLSRAIANSTYGEIGFNVGRFRILRRIVYFLLLVAIFIGFVNIFAEETLFRFAELKGENSRFCNYPSIWRAFLDNWKFGTGFGTFEVVFPIYRDPACGVKQIWLQAHNFWLEGLLGFGIIFIPIAFFVVGRLVFVYWTGVKTRHTQRFVSYIGLAIVALVSLHSYVEFSLQIPGVALYVTAILAAISVLSLGRVRSKKRKRRQ